MSEAIDAAFVPPQESVGWAQDAIEELNREAHRFFNGDFKTIFTEVDTKTGENVRKVRLTQALPAMFRRKANEALTTTKHAFDQAAFAARNLTSGRDAKLVYYPWAQNPRDLERRIIGFDERLWDTFRGHQPYPRGDGYTGGDDEIRALATMANDKHTVGLTVGAQIINSRHPPIRIGAVAQSLTLLVPQWDSVKNEAELMRWTGDLETHGEHRFVFEILFKNARLTEPVNVLRGLRSFSIKAKTVVESLKARCLELESAGG
jgi:hypothetical protein